MTFCYQLCYPGDFDKMSWHLAWSITSLLGHWGLWGCTTVAGGGCYWGLPLNHNPLPFTSKTSMTLFCIYHFNFWNNVQPSLLKSCENVIESKRHLYQWHNQREIGEQATSSLAMHCLPHDTSHTKLLWRLTHVIPLSMTVGWLPWYHSSGSLDYPRAK